MDEYLKFSDDSIDSIHPGSAKQSGNILFVYLEDDPVDFNAAFLLLSDPNNVELITYHYYRVDLVFEGFTDLTLLQKDGKRVIAILEKGE